MSLLPFLSLLLLHLFIPCNSFTCLPSSKCGDIQIKYPFSLYIPQTPNSYDETQNRSTCGYPGLSISCENKTPILHLQSDNYTVTSINYITSTITLADTDILNPDDSCPRVKHNVSFHSYDWINFTNFDMSLIFFFNCSSPDPPPKFTSLTCFGGNKFNYVIPSVYANPLEYSYWVYQCEGVVVAPIFNNSYDPSNLSNGFGSSLKKGFQLQWDKGESDNCTKCEAKKGQCGYNLTSDNNFVEACFCLNNTCSTTINATGTGDKNKRDRILIGAVLGAAVLIVLIFLLFFFIRRKKRQSSNSSKLLMHSRSTLPPNDSLYKYSHDEEMEVDTNKMFSYQELEEATNGFNNEIGDGGFGTVYKGKLRDGRIVAIKRLYEHNYRRMEQFLNEVQILSHLRHPNLVALYGSTSRHSQELLLVYEYIPNGTLADHLHGPLANKRALTWPIRLSIAIETANALTYLHAVEPQIIHRDVKTNNILLDSGFHVKVADFGLSRLFPIDVTHVSTAPQGTPGYLDPEYHQCYQLTDKSDVYSFGVVLVELISSMPAVDISRRRNEINLASMAISKIQKCELDLLVDPWLGYGSDEATRKMITMVAELAFRCLQQDGDMRPPIREVLEVLVGIQKEANKMEKTNGEVEMETGIEDDKGLLKSVMPLSPDSVATKWISRNTTPNASE